MEKLRTIDYDAGYRQALVDLFDWVYCPTASLNSVLFTKNRLRVILSYIIDNVDDFMCAPYNFKFEFRMNKKGQMKIIDP